MGVGGGLDYLPCLRGPPSRSWRHVPVVFCKCGLEAVRKPAICSQQEKDSLGLRVTALPGLRVDGRGLSVGLFLRRACCLKILAKKSEPKTH